MKIRIALVALVSLTACSSKPTAAAPHTGMASTSEFFASINANADGKALFDAYPVLRIAPGDACTVSFETKTGSTVVDWRRSGNLVSSKIEGHLLTKLQDGSGQQHVLDAPGGEVGERLESSVTYLSSLCPH